METAEDKVLEAVALDLSEISSDMSQSIELRLGAINGAMSLGGSVKDMSLGGAELVGMYKNSLSSAARLKAASDTPAVSLLHIDAYSKAVSVADNVTVSRMILEQEGESKGFSRYELLEPDVQSGFSEDIRIAYRKARGADIAFEKFASLIPDAAALYRETFPAVCDAVALGDADMCILPYENTEDGKLGSFYRLIESYDLKIAASSLVRSDRREDMTRYLLLSRSLVGLSMLSGVTDFEFSITDRADGALTRTLAAAHLLGLNVRSIDTVRSEREYNVYDIRVTSDEAALDTFILYLKLEAEDFSPLGVYAVID